MKKKIIKSFFTLGILISACSTTSCSFINQLLSDISLNNPFSSNDNAYVKTTHNRSSYSKTGVYNANLPTAPNSYNLSDIEYKGNYLTNHDLGLMNDLNYAPSTGDTRFLVVPVIFNQSTNYQGDYSQNFVSKLDDVFFSETSIADNWESVHSFYDKSSYGLLNINGEVAEPYYINKSFDEIVRSFKNENDAYNYVSSLVNTIANKYKRQVSNFDSNDDGCFDGIWLVYNVDDYHNQRREYSNYDADILWAYTSYNKADSLAPIYAWASYNFMQHTSKSTSGATKTYTKDARTFIHETGHMLGLDDYYNYDSTAEAYNSPVGGQSMMDANIGDMDPHSKFLLDWINPKVVNNVGRFTLKSFSETGQTVIIPSTAGFDNTVFDEYLMLAVYDPSDELQKEDSTYVYEGVSLPTERGLQVFYVNSKLGLIKEAVYGNDLYYINASYLDSSDITDTLVKSNNMVQIINSNSPSWSYNPSISNLQENVNKLELISKDYNIRSSSYARYSNLNNAYAYPSYANSDLYQKNDSFMSLKVGRRKNVFSFGEIAYSFSVVEDDGETMTIEVTQVS